MEKPMPPNKFIPAPCPVADAEMLQSNLSRQVGSYSFPVEKASVKEIGPIIAKHIAKQSALQTNEGKRYIELGEKFADHQGVNRVSDGWVRVATYSVLCVALVLMIVIVATALVPSPELPGTKKPMWRLVQNLLAVGIVGAIGGTLAAILMHAIANGRVPPESYIYPTACTFWGVAVILVSWKFASPTSFSTGIVQILLQTAAITVGLFLGKGLMGKR
jgi:hypothetical protein